MDTLKSLIKNKGYTVKHFAGLLGVEKDTVYNYTTNRTLPSLEVYWKMSDLLDIPLGDLRLIIEAAHEQKK